MKVVINSCFGGFGLSNEAYDWLIENKNWKVTEYSNDGHGYKDPEAKIVKHPSTYSTSRNGFEYYLVHGSAGQETRCDLDLIDCIEALKDKANGRCAKLQIIEVPDHIDWQIEEYDGNEHVAETHRTWG